MANVDAVRNSWTELSRSPARTKNVCFPPKIGAGREPFSYYTPSSLLSLAGNTAYSQQPQNTPARCVAYTPQMPTFGMFVI